MGQNVVAFQNGRDDFPLNNCGVFVVQVLARLCQHFRQEKLVERDQILLIVVSFCVGFELLLMRLTFVGPLKQFLRNFHIVLLEFFQDAIFDGHVEGRFLFVTVAVALILITLFLVCF